MNKFIGLLTTSLILLLAASTASATMITGEISFTGESTTNGAGGVVTSIDFQTFNVDVVKGDFIPDVTAGDVVTFNDLPVMVATNDLWSVGGFTFDLTSITLNSLYSNFGLVEGIGLVEKAGYEATLFHWYFSSQLGQAKTFSATAVPAPAGAALLGLGLLGFGFARRNKKA